MNDEKNCKSIKMGINVTTDTIVKINTLSNISELYISGVTAMKDINHGFVRVTLVDDYNVEYLVYELYPLLADSTILFVRQIGIETKSLDNVNIRTLKIEVADATFCLDSIYYTNTSMVKKRNREESVNIQDKQRRYIIDRLNTNLRARHIPWEAGLTSVARMTYDEKKALFGGKMPNLGGFEYYVGGIFVMPDKNESKDITKASLNSTLDPYVQEWDWRNQHGKKDIGILYQSIL